MQGGSILVASDISDEMIGKFKARFEDPKNGFKLNKSNRLIVIKEDKSDIKLHTLDSLI